MLGRATALPHWVSLTTPVRHVPHPLAGVRPPEATAQRLPACQTELPFQLRVRATKLGHVPEASQQTTTVKRLAELRRAQPHDATLQNLLAVLTAKLDLSARLPVFEYEAESEGFADTASFMSALASSERESLEDILACLRSHIDRTSERFSSRVTS